MTLFITYTRQAHAKCVNDTPSSIGKQKAVLGDTQRIFRSFSGTIGLPDFPMVGDGGGWKIVFHLKCLKWPEINLKGRNISSWPKKILKFNILKPIKMP